MEPRRLQYGNTVPANFIQFLFVVLCVYNSSVLATGPISSRFSKVAYSPLFQQVAKAVLIVVRERETQEITIVSINSGYPSP